MVHYYDSISDELRDWALQQQVFFIASAPLSGKHINLSPKGLPARTLAIFDPNHVGYIDATGSGIETVSHMYENGRATIMFCSFDKSPRIMRWFCKGKVIEWDSPEFDMWLSRMDKKNIVGARTIILLTVFKGEVCSSLCCVSTAHAIILVQTSCGYAVPQIVSSAIDPEYVLQGPRAYLKDRETLGHWAGQQVEKGTLHAYHQKMNTRSLDGCAGLKAARRANGENLLLNDAYIWIKRTTGQWQAMLLGAVLALMLMVSLRAATEIQGVRFPTHLRMLA